jgi:hypothetical protein
MRASSESSGRRDFMVAFLETYVHELLARRTVDYACGGRTSTAPTGASDACDGLMASVCRVTLPIDGRLPRPIQ